jgi:hypothetical protein
VNVNVNVNPNLCERDAAMSLKFANSEDALFHDVHSGGARHQLTSGHQLTATSGHILTTCIRRDERGGARLA